MLGGPYARTTEVQTVWTVVYDSDTEAVSHLPETIDVFDTPPVGDQEGPIIKNTTQMLHVSLSPTRDCPRRAHWS